MDGSELREVLKLLLLPPASPMLVAAAGVLLSLRLRRVGAAIAAAGLVAAWLTATWGLADAMFNALEAGQRPLDAAALRAAMQGPDAPQAVVVL
ncbi:MAG TPA: hypothetical protein PKC20_17375, partial [Burkholderiaceae bacterium]|nr:hypothetical protein [Burkholderiaceae bacterium]